MSSKGKELLPGLGVWGTLHGMLNLVIFGLTLGLLSNLKGSMQSNEELGSLILGVVVLINACCCGQYCGGGLLPLGFGIYVAYRLHEGLSSGAYDYTEHHERARNIAISIAVFGGLHLALDLGKGAYNFRLGKLLHVKV